MSAELESAIDRLDQLRRNRRAATAAQQEATAASPVEPAAAPVAPPLAGLAATEEDQPPSDFSTAAQHLGSPSGRETVATPILVVDDDEVVPVTMPQLGVDDEASDAVGDDAPDDAPRSAAALGLDEARTPAGSADGKADELGAIDASRLATGRGHRRMHRSTLALIAVAALLICVALVVVSVIFSGGPSEAPKRTAAPVGPRPTQAAEPAKPAVADGPLPLTAQAVGTCPGGTDASGAIDGRQETAWVCPSGGTGKVVRLTLPKPYVVTAVSIVPGFNYRNPNGTDEWMNYRVVRRLTWIFNDAGKTSRPQTTSGLRSAALLEVPNVVASQITVLIQETAAPTDGGQTPPTTPGAGGGLFGGSDAAGSTATVSKAPSGLAISELNVIGHEVN